MCDERVVVERAGGKKENEAHRQRADATNTAREREEDGDEGDQPSVVANPIVIAAGRRGL